MRRSPSNLNQKFSPCPPPLQHGGHTDSFNTSIPRHQPFSDQELPFQTLSISHGMQSAQSSGGTSKDLSTMSLSLVVQSTCRSRAGVSSFTCLFLPFWKALPSFPTPNIHGLGYEYRRDCLPHVALLPLMVKVLKNSKKAEK